MPATRSATAPGPAGTAERAGHRAAVSASGRAWGSAGQRGARTAANRRGRDPSRDPKPRGGGAEPSGATFALSGERGGAEEGDLVGLCARTWEEGERELRHARCSRIPGARGGRAAVPVLPAVKVAPRAAVRSCKRRSRCTEASPPARCAAPPPGAGPRPCARLVSPLGNGCVCVCPRREALICLVRVPPFCRGRV